LNAGSRAALGAAGLSLAAAALIAIACRGGGGLSLEEYFRSIDGIGDEATLRFGERAVEPPAADASEQELAEYARATLRESAAILREARDSFDKLDPPSEVRKPHEQFVDALTTTMEAVDEIAEGLPDTLSAEELAALDTDLDTPEINEAGDQLNEACRVLQAIADSNKIDVDLRCQ
jgi:hypothetical protein